MTGGENLRDSHSTQTLTHLSEVEIFRLLQEAVQKYEECMRVADLADASAEDEFIYPRYAWDNPMGLVATEPSNAKLG